MMHLLSQHCAAGPVAQVVLQHEAGQHLPGVIQPQLWVQQPPLNTDVLVAEADHGDVFPIGEERPRASSQLNSVAKRRIIATVGEFVKNGHNNTNNNMNNNRVE